MTADWFRALCAFFRLALGSERLIFQQHADFSEQTAVSCYNCNYKILLGSFTRMNSKKSTARRVDRHLFAGENGYFARIGVPADLRPIVGKRELWGSVRAESDAKAIRKAHAVIARFHATFDAARAQAKAARQASRGRLLTPPQLAATQYNDRIRVDDEFRNAKKGQAKGNFEAFIRKAFNVTTKKKLAIVGRKVWHSFRHTFKTGLARAGVDRSTRDLLCGHADSSAGGIYVHDVSVEALKDAIEKLRFDGFMRA